MSISVVYSASTGHVMGALAVTGGTPSADVALLVGDSLPLRISLPTGEVAVLSLTDRQLGAGVVDDEPGVFVNSLAFGVTLEEDKPKPTLAQLATWDTDLELTAQGLTIKVPVPNASRATPVLALISDGPATHVLVNEIPAGKTDVTIPVTVGSGEHGLLVLVEGWAGRLEPVST
jgi:hypothetical protein